MVFTTDYKLENYILNTRWEDLPAEVQERLKGCFVDLMGALCISSRSKQFDAGLRLANSLFGKGNTHLIGCGGSGQENLIDLFLGIGCKLCLCFPAAGNGFGKLLGIGDERIIVFHKNQPFLFGETMLQG